MTTSVRRPPGPAAHGPRRPVRRRLAGQALRLLIGVLLVAAVLLGAGWVLTPSVGNAADLVAAQLSGHSAPALNGPVPERVADALLATEDSRFYSTPGLDPVSVLRLPVAVVEGQDAAGATLEQQLAKNLYEPGRSDPAAKATEAVLALKLDRAWTKQQILRMYFDDGYYGHGFYGLTAASEGYFGVTPADLSWAQASLLAGLFQAPSAYDPVENPAAARARQAHVLDRLVAVGDLTRAQADAIAGQSWGLRAG